MRAIALLALSACRLGFDPVAATDGGRGSADAGVDAALPTTLRVDVVVFTSLSTCVVGDTCVSNCITLQNDANVDQFKFANNANFHVVAPGDPKIAAAQVSKCLTTTLNPGEVTSILTQLDMVATNVASYSGGSLALDLQVHQINSATALAQYTTSIWVDPGVVASVVPPTSDLVFVINDLRDDTAALHMPFQFCGLSFDVTNGPDGHGYVWIPFTTSFSAADCSTYGNYRNYVMGEIYAAVKNASGFVDAYNGTYPACGATTVDPARWYPDPGGCKTDPDSPTCGVTDCSPVEDDYHRHMLGAHWTRNLVTTLNHCHDGLMDLGETGVDTGGGCP